MTESAVNSAPAEARDRYAGPRSYADDPIDEALFFGREEDADALLHRVRAYRTLILFGRSGLGKTSLLQAGLYPRLRKRDFFPVTVRLNNQDAGAAQAVISAVEAACGQRKEVEEEVNWVRGDDADLWSFFKSTDLWRGETLLTPVLVLDQFEEVFTLRNADFRRELAAELRDLVETGLAHAARRRRAAEGKLPHGEGSPDIRLVISLREEYLAALEELVADVPSLLEQRYRLTPMAAVHARRAIVDPAAKVIPGVSFRTPPFGYTEGALGQLKEELSNEAGEVELIHLQILCQAVERRLAERQGVEEPEVTEQTLGGEKSLQRISADFYRTVMRRLSWPVERSFARRLCEQGLLSPEGHRVSIEEGQACRKYHVTERSLAKLVDSRLVRRDTRPGLKGFYYELSHDSLARSVFRHRRSRFVRKTAVLSVLALILAGSVVLYLYQAAQQSAQVAQALTAGFRDKLRVGTPGPEMVVIPAGTFQMGCVSGARCQDYEEPVREVQIRRPFALGRYEVTLGEFRRFADASGYRTEAEEIGSCYVFNPDTGWTLEEGASWQSVGFEQTDVSPVVCVTWRDASRYAAWLSEQTGKAYRLPSEAEWEYAARAGTRTEFWWGDRIGSNRANCDGCGSRWDGKETAPVGSFASNPFGLHDTAGNVWEWVQDCWHDNYEGAPKDGSAWGEKGGGDCGRRVLRGGSWYNTPVYLRSASRSGSYAGTRYYSIGFRLAQDL